MGVLRNIKHEQYAQLIVAGVPQREAAQRVGYKTVGFARSPAIQARIKELLEKAAARSRLSREDILNGLFDDIQLARKLGQVSSAIRGWELMGKETHKMFVERKEIGAAGDFDAKSEDELKDIIKREVEALKAEGLDLSVSGSEQNPFDLDDSHPDGVTIQ